MTAQQGWEERWRTAWRTSTVGKVKEPLTRRNGKKEGNKNKKEKKKKKKKKKKQRDEGGGAGAVADTDERSACRRAEFNHNIPH